MKTLLAIPVFNEARYLQRVISRARQFVPDILVVDDGSTDRTPELLEGLDCEVVRHAENRGYGQSLATAFSHAIERDDDWLITMDCDEQHEASYIPLFQAACRRDEADVISGTRYAGGFDRGREAPADRRAINREMTTLINARLGLSITDAFCGFKAYRVSVLRHFAITVPGYAMPMQFWVQAHRHGLRVEELPVRLIYNDPDRHFGGLLDDPTARRRHYLDVFEAELARAGRTQASGVDCCPCR